jgi:hypothetical protein
MTKTIIAQSKTMKQVTKKTSLDSTNISCRSAYYKGLAKENPKEYEELKARKRRGRFWNRILTGSRMLRHQLKRGYSFKFLTLTSSYKSKNDITRDFDVFWKRLRRKFRFNEIAYFKVVEKNKKGDLLHLHLIIYTPYIKVEEIRKMWYEIRSAYEVYIKRIPMKELKMYFGYLGKYMSKDMARRFAYSRSWFLGLSVSVMWKAMVRNFFTLTDGKRIDWLIETWNEFMKYVFRKEYAWDLKSLYDFCVLSSWEASSLLTVEGK